MQGLLFDPARPDGPQKLDELTAHRWRREGVFCPRRDGKGRPCGTLLEWDDGAAHLSCEHHGEVFQVVRAA